MGVLEKRRKSSKPGSKGQTIVEVTLIFPLLVLLVGAAVDWGMGLFVSHVVQNAVREGARAAVTRTTIDVTATTSLVNSVIPNTSLFSQFRSNVAVSCVTVGGSPFVRVQTSGTFNFTFLRLLGFTNMNILRWAEMRYERFATCP